MHAQASRVHIQLTDSNSEITLRVQDNGNGMAASRRSETQTFGLIGMRERAAMLGGSFQLDSEPGTGTCIVMTLPRQPSP